MSSTELVELLEQYRMTFVWGAIAKKWWILAPVEHGCNQNTVPIPADNFNAAQEAALKYIQVTYPLL